jgi:hypothetical protein
MSTWNLDLPEQQKVELLVALYFSRKFDGLIWPNGKGKQSGKDFVLYRMEKFEVKCDKEARNTNNFYFEIRNTKQNCPSGLAATKANTWIHFVPPSRLFYGPVKGMLDKLKELREAGIAWTNQTPGGDDNSQAIIVPIDTFLQHWDFKEEFVELGN